MYKYRDKKTKHRVHRGETLVLVMVFGSVSFVIIVLGLLGFALFEYQSSIKIYQRDVAFHLSEAGINYYRWHLAHNPNDLTDGTGVPGEHVHSIKNKLDVVVGSFSVTATSTLLNSSVISVASTGTAAQGGSTRTLKVRLGFPSFADSAFLENANMSFSATTQVHGEVMSNGGIRFDGTTDSWIKSAKTTYTYQGQSKPGIWGSGGPQYYWDFPVPSVDFGSVTADLSALRTKSDQGGKHLLSSGREGWQIVFRGTVYDLYRVTTKDCYYGEGRWRRRSGQWYWEGTTYCFDVGNRTLVSTNGLPANGIIFVEDDLWIQGVVDGRIVIAVGTFPVQGEYKRVFISGNLTQKQQASDDVIGIMAQGEIVVPYEAPSTMEIHAAALSQNAEIYTPYYNPGEHAGALKNSLTFYGSQISYEGGGWKYINDQGQVVSGYLYTNHVYDGNLQYQPPPGFPTGSTYELISWEEVK